MYIYIFTYQYTHTHTHTFKKLADAVVGPGKSETCRIVWQAGNLAGLGLDAAVLGQIFFFRKPPFLLLQSL